MSSRATTPAVSGTPRLAAKISRSGQSRFSVSRIRRNHGNRTSIVDRIATIATLTTSVVSRKCSAVSAFVACGIESVNYTAVHAPATDVHCLHPGRVDQDPARPAATNQRDFTVAFLPRCHHASRSATVRLALAAGAIP